MPHISIIIPAFNAAPYIAETVRSALTQTYRDFEIIVVDDGSTDGTAAALDDLRGRIVIHQQPNAGVARARNAAMALASGEWVAFLDADDLWLPDKLERQLAAVGNADMVYTDRFNFGATGGLPERQSDVTPMTDGDLFVPLMLDGNFITLSSVMVRRKVIADLGGFFAGLSGAADWDMWLRVAASHPIALCHEPLVRYRFHAQGMSRNHRAMSRERTMVIARALASDRGRRLDWRLRRRIWAETWRTNAWDAGQGGARVQALKDYARAAVAWPLATQPYKEAFRVCLNA